MKLDNQWADPAGQDTRGVPVRYVIRRAVRGPDNRLTPGEPIERETELSLDSVRNRWYHALAPADQHFADKITVIIQAGCAYFYASTAEYQPLAGVPDVVISDAEVSARIARLDGGENTREAERTHKDHYPLSELPAAQQRALVEQIEALKREWQFQILGP